MEENVSDMMRSCPCGDCKYHQRDWWLGWGAHFCTEGIVRLPIPKTADKPSWCPLLTSKEVKE